MKYLIYYSDLQKSCINPQKKYFFHFFDAKAAREQKDAFLKAGNKARSIDWCVRVVVVAVFFTNFCKKYEPFSLLLKL